MDYLYIPTATLNFNNILSTGSISPAAVYVARQFGYKQFEDVKPNRFSNIILLYDRYPEFVLEDTVRDNYPMVLRVRAEPLQKKHLVKQLTRKDDVTVYACNETIYFDLASTDFLFPTQQTKQIALTKAEPSLTTKLVELYHQHMIVPSPDELKGYTWTETILEGIKDGDKAAIFSCADKDNHINRLKGFASGYILGAYKSIDPKHAHILSQMRTHRNEASSILNNPSRKLPKAIRKEVEFAYHTLENFFTYADIGSKRFEPNEGDGFWFKDGMIVELKDRHVPDACAIRPLIQFVNNFCMSSHFYGQLEEQRLEVAMQGATAIRNLLESQWEGSNYQKYINALLNNIKSGSEFDFKDSTSLALQSFAAFILKGDDLEKMEAFLMNHGIGNLRIAFALWGAMFGFSKLPKTVYNLPLNMGEKDYAKRMHDYVHSTVHEIPL
jgi:hypothetical protein